MTRPTLQVLLSLGASGCVIGADRWPRPSELPPTWLVEDAQILAVVAEPPEARPGDVVTFDALIPDPTDRLEGVVWLACPFTEDAVEGLPICALDLEGFDLEDATAEDLTELGVIGFEPGLAPSLVVPTDTLEGVEDPLEGVYASVQVIGLPTLDPTETGLEIADLEIGYKRLIVSNSTTPNHNPSFLELTVDGLPVAPGQTVVVDPHATYTVEAHLTDDALEDYVYVNSDGVTESRTEEPYITWYASGGELFETITLYPYLDVTWRAGPYGQPATVWAVLRDRRGGMAWREVAFTVGAAAVPP